MPAARNTEPPGAGTILLANEDVRSMISDFSRWCLAGLPLACNYASSEPEAAFRQEAR